MAKTIEELEEEYSLLVEEENAIPVKIKDNLDKIDLLTTQINDLQNKIQDINIEISKLPSTVDKKTCSCAFMCMGNHCEHYQAPNPAIANGINRRNVLVGEANAKQREINSYFDQIASLTNRKVEIERAQIEIRNKMIDLRQSVIAEPFSILELLGLRKKPLLTEEAIGEEPKEDFKLETTKLVKYAMFGLAGYILAQDILRVKKEIKVRKEK